MRGRKTLKTGKAWDETSRGDRHRVDVPHAHAVGLGHKNVFTREHSTYALVRTLTLGVRMQAIQPIYCATSFSDWAAVTHEARRACREPLAEY